MDALENNGFRQEFTYQEENIPNDINKEKNKKSGRKNRKEKLYGLTLLFVD